MFMLMGSFVARVARKEMKTLHEAEDYEVKICRRFLWFHYTKSKVNALNLTTVLVALDEVFCSLKPRYFLALTTHPIKIRFHHSFLLFLASSRAKADDSPSRCIKYLEGKWGISFARLLIKNTLTFPMRVRVKPEGKLFLDVN